MTGAQIVQTLVLGWRCPTPGWSSCPAWLPTLVPRSRRTAHARASAPAAARPAPILAAMLRTRMLQHWLRPAGG
jgi:hypothetical protein